MKIPKKTTKSRIKKAVVKPKRRSVKPLPPAKKPVKNCHHPDVAHQVEEAFMAGGIQYYRFKNEYQMPTGRYKWVMNYLHEVDLRMSLETMRAYMQNLRNLLNGGKRGIIDITEISKIIISIESRLNLAFEPETVKRLASVTYFDDMEALDGYDMEYNRKKRQIWEESGTLDFFLTNPIAELLNLNNFSPEALQEYMKETVEILENPIFDPLRQQQENTSESGTNQ